MAALAGGTFEMGERHDTVTLQPLCLDTTEVTVDAYAACVQSGQCTADHPGQSSRDGVTFEALQSCNYGVAGRGNHPMNCVDWAQSAKYCRAQGKRLPTEEEREWAARGQSRGTVYPWGNDAPSSHVCWVQAGGTCPAGKYPASDAPGGIHDLAANVLEWTATHYDPTTYVVRGAAWFSTAASDLRAANRKGSAPSGRFQGVGFRCAR